MIDEYSRQRKFWSQVEISETGCWLWVGSIRDNGYGIFCVKNQDGKWIGTTSHRFAYQDQVKEIPISYEVDHLCRVRNCVRPEHLEAVTVRENRKRRDEKRVFEIPTDIKPLPIVPPKPKPLSKIDRTKFCKNGHEYAVVGKVVNGFSKDGERLFTCAECRKIEQIKKWKNNRAKDRKSCPQGHPYSGDNLRQRVKYKNGHPYNARECRQCETDRRRKNAISVNLFSENVQ